MKLHSNIIATGKPFIILHGFLGMGDNWKTMAKKIAGLGYQVHLVDQRNHGRSPHSDAFNYALMAADLKEYCEEHQLKKIVLLGHSMGGKTAMYFAATHPGMVSALMIADIGPKYYPLHHQDILDGLQSLDFTVLQKRDEVDAALSTYVVDAGVRMFLMKNLFWKEKGQLALRINLTSLIANVSQIGEELVKEFCYLGRTLFLKGQRSTYILKEDTDRINKQFPDNEIVEISNAGHWLQAENPKVFLEVITKFVKNHS